MLSDSKISSLYFEALGSQHLREQDRTTVSRFALAVEAEVRAQALSEAYDLLFDVKGCKATRFDAQNAIRAMAAPVDVQAWIALARARLKETP